MYENILIGFDGSPESHDALHLAKALAAPDDCRLILVSVIERDRFGLSTRLREDDGITEAARIAALARPVMGDRRFETAIAAGSPARVVSELARKHRADLIAIGSTNRDQLGGVVVGGAGERLFQDARTPVAVAPRGFGRYEHVGLGLIAVGYDGTAASQLALLEARRLASRLQAELRVVTVVPELSRSRAVYMPALREHFEALESGIASLNGLEAEPCLVVGDPATVLAAQGVEADLLVIGSRGRGPLRRAALGAVSARVTRAAPCPVIVVPRTAGASRDRAAEAYTQRAPALGGQPIAPTRR